MLARVQTEAAHRCAAAESTDNKEAVPDRTEPEYERLVQELVNDAKDG